MKNMFFLLVALFVTACQAWSPTLQRLEQQCGVDWVKTQDQNRIVQLTSPEGTQLTAAESEAVRARFEGVEQNLSLAVSSKGCVTVPDTAGTLLAQNSLRSWALAEKVDGSRMLDSRFQTRRFIEPKPYRVELVCPVGGWLVDDRLESVLSFQGDLDANLTELQLEVRNGDLPATQLLQKNLGLAWDASLGGFNLSALQEGRYELRLNVRDLRQDWESDSITSFSACPMQVIRHIPAFKQSSLSKDKVHAQGTVLTPELEDPSDRLFVCREAGLIPAGSMGCQPQSSCRDEASFKEQSLIRLDDVGAWTYYFHGKNRLGQRNALSCLPTFVNNQAPGLSLQWSKAAWNEPEATEKSLPPEMEALIAVQSDILSTEDLEQNLSCKVDFVFRGASVFPGDKVVCLADACLGQPMGSYVPCSPRMKFAVSEALQTEFLRDSEVRLSVKAQDGAGHETIRTLSLWLQDSQHRTLDFTNMGPEDLEFNDYPTNFWFAQNGGLLVQVGPESAGRFRYLKRSTDWGYSNAWTPGNAGGIPGKPVSTSVVQREDGRIFAIHPTYETAYKRFFAEFIDGNWREIAIEGWDPLTEMCQTLTLDYAGRLTCLNRNEIIAIDPDQARAVRSKVFADDSEWNCGFGASLLTTPTGLQYLFCGEDRVLMRDQESPWQTLFLPGKWKAALESKVFDQQGRLWIQATDYNARPVTDYILLIEGSSIKSIALPTDVEQFANYPTWKSFALDEQGRPLYADRRWNQATQSWDALPELRQWLGQGPMRVVPVRGTQHGLWYETSRFMLYLNQGARQLFPLKSLNWPSPDYQSFPALSPRNQLCFRFRSDRGSQNMRCQNDRIWSRLGRNYLNLPKDKILYTNHTREGQPLAITAKEGAFVWQGSGWKNVAPPPPRPVETFGTSYFYADGVFYCRQRREIFRFVPGEKNWELAFSFPDYTGIGSGWGEFIFKDDAGRIWFTLSGGGLIRYDGRTWKLAKLDQNLVPMDIMGFGDRLFMVAAEKNDAGDFLRQNLFWVDPLTLAASRIDAKAEFGWDSELVAPDARRSTVTAMDRGAMMLTQQNDSFKNKSVIFDLVGRKQILVDDYTLEFNQKIVGFSRIDADHFLYVYPRQLGGALGPDNEFRVISSKGDKALVFSNFEMKLMEDNFDLAPSIAGWSLDSQKRLWIPAATFNQDVSDELFRIDLKPWLF